MNTSSDIPDGNLLAGRYRISGVIGRGGMATVYRARDETLGRPVAVKVLTVAAEMPEAVVRQSAEAQIGASLNHPGLVTVFDVHADADPPFLVMELVEGITLSDALERGSLASRAVAEVGAQLAGALAVVHATGIIHRDIKPSNVMLVEGDAPAVKLTDFGISRMVDSTRITSPGLLVGTARYLSPEQAAGRTVGQKADIYSLGLVLLECLTGETVFPGTQMETLSARLHRQPEVPERFGAGWVNVLTAMTAMEPADRPDARAAEAALRTVAAGGTPSLPIGAAAAAAAGGAAAAAAVGDGTQVLGAAAPGPATGTAPIAPTSYGAAAAGGHRAGGHETDPRSGRSRGMMWAVVALVVAVLALGGIIWATQDGDAPNGPPADTPTTTEPEPTEDPTRDSEPEETQDDPETTEPQETTEPTTEPEKTTEPTTEPTTEETTGSGDEDSGSAKPDREKSKKPGKSDRSDGSGEETLEEEFESDD